MKKTLQKSSLLIIGMLISLFAFTQTTPSPVLNFQSIPSGPYGKGSSIAVLFKPEGVIPRGSSFNLYLSESDGTFQVGKAAIGTINSHYTTYINGLIPSNAIAGNNYKLKVEIVIPGSPIVSQEIPNFTITIQDKLGSNGDSNGDFLVPTNATGGSTIYLRDNTLKYYGFSNCLPNTTTKLNLFNKTGLSVTWTSKNEFDYTNITPGPSFSADPFAQTATLAANANIEITQTLKKVHYRFFQQATDASQANTISTKAFYFINNQLSAPFSVVSNTICYEPNQAGAFSFKVDIDSTREGSAFFNFPAASYTSRWDDNTPNEINAIRTIIFQNGLLNHNYSRSSCGEKVDRGIGQVTYNSFGPSMTATHITGCTTAPVEVITPVQIFPKPKLDFTAPEKACLGANVTFTNTSNLGLQGSTTVDGCTEPNITFEWFVDGVKVASTRNLTLNNLTVGTHRIVLSPVIGSGIALTCEPEVVAKNICIESIPPNTAKFALINTDNARYADTSFCPNNSSFSVINQSGTLSSGSYCSTLNYNWKLTGPAGFTEITSTVTSSTPNFTVPSLTIKGNYTLTLTISNPCGTSNAYTRIITVLERPAITSQPTNKTVCDGLNTTFSAVAVGSNLTYKWQVLTTANGATYTDVTNTGVYTGATTASLNITGATTSMNGYKYKLVISGSCTPDVTSNEVTLTVNPRPTSVISGSTTVCANTPATISIALTGTAPWNITYSDGTTSTSVTTSSSTYTFTVALATTKTYTVTSLTDANCTAVAGDRTGSAIITVNPLPTISGTLNACLGSTTQLSGSATANATTPWSSASTGVATISNTGLVTGVSSGTSVITYTNSNGCIITATVTINPLPTVSIPNTTQSLCLNLTPPSITTLTPTTFTTISSYRWFSNPTASNTGGTQVATTSTFTPPNTNAGELFYYLTVTNNNGCVATSNVSGSIKVYGKPTITALPTTTSYCINAPAATLTPTITNGGYGTLNYQWYSNTTASTSGATLIANETNATFTPPTTAAGVKYYYVVVTNGGPTSSSECNTATSGYAEIKVYARPTIPTDPVSATYCAGATPVALTVPNATNGGYGSTTYQWYSNTTSSTTGGTLIGSAATYTPNISSAGTTYYYVNINNGGTGGASGCNNLNSAIATITVHPLPVITSATFATQSLCISSTATSMTASATTSTGTITSYQWFSNANASNTGGILITGETNATFTPPTNATGTTYYYCEVTNSWGCKATTAVSGAIKVYSAATISAQPVAADYCVSPSAQATLLSVTAATNAPGSLIYQWYSNTNNSNSGGTQISGASNATYRPAITAAGATYYYVEVGNNGPAGCATTKSNATLINVFSTPIINTNVVSSNYCKDANANAISVTASSPVGALTYQWYENTTASNSNGTIINNANSATYTPSTTTVGTKHYYVVITNGGPTNTCNTATSGIATINVFAPPTITSDPVSATYCKDNTVTALTVGGATTGGLGTLTYQWFSNTTNTNSGGTTITNTTATYTPLSTNPGTYYYYVEVRNGATGGATACNTRPSNVATITIHPLPVSTSTFATESLCISSTASSMTASATTATGTIASYQWYSNTASSYANGTLINGATNATFTPPTSTTGTTYYFCEITNSWGCSTRTAISGAINVYAAPVITTQPTGATYCQNISATALSVTATAGGLGTPNYQWYSNTTNSNSGGTLLTGATSATYTPSTSTVGTTYYYVVINNGGGAAGCSLLSSNAVAIVVNDLPVINAFALGTQTLCLNATPSNLSVTASTATGTISATGYQWYTNTTNSTSGASLITGANTSTYTPPTNLAGTKYYFAVINNSFNCTTTTIVSGAINVNPLPTISSQPSQNIQTKCLNETFTALSVTATAGSGSILKYEWYSNTTNSTTGGTLVATNSTNALTNSYTPLSSSPGILYYYVIVYNTNGCQITSAISAPFTVNDLPSISVQPSTSNQTACLNTPTTNLTVSASPGSGSISNYTWYRTSSLSGSPVWTTVATNTTSSTTNSYTPVSTSVGTLYYYVIVTNSNGCIKASTASGSVTINPVAIINDQVDTYCSGFTFSRQLLTGGGITVPANTTFSWNAPSVTGGITGGAPGSAETTLNGTLVNPTNVPQTATYTVTPRTGSCDGATFTYTVTINPRASITVADLNACSGTAFEFQPVHGTNGNIIPTNTTYAWLAPLVTGGITGGATANSQTKFIGNLTNPNNTQKTATYTITPTSPVGPCIGSNFTIVVNVNARPVIANKTQTICSGTAFSIRPENAGSEIVPANTTYSWTVQNNANVSGQSNGNTTGTTISQTLTNNSHLVQTVVYTVTPVSGDVGNCPGTSFTITVTVNPKPSISAKTVTACSNQLFTTLITNGVNSDIVPNGITYTWSAPNVTGFMTGGAAGNAATSVSGNLSNPTSVNQTATYTVRPTVPGSTICTGDDFTVIATIKPKAIIATKTTTACSNDGFTFTLLDGADSDVIPTGTTYTWSSVPTVTGGLTGGTTGSAQNSVGGTLVNPSNTSQTATYNVTANSDGCSSTPFSATATIFAKPFINTQNVSSCSGSAFSVPLSNGGGNILPNATTYTWTVSQNSNVTGASNVNVATSPITQTLTNNTNTDQLVAYTVTPTSGAQGNCVGLPFTVNVTVKPKPSVTPQTESICSGNNFTNLPTNGNGNIIPAGTTFTWNTTPTSNPIGAVSGGSAQTSPQTLVRQLLTNNTNAPATLTYNVIPAASGCSGLSYQLIVNVNPKPAITSMSATICSSETFTLTPTNGTNGIVPANTTYTWEVIDNPNVTGESNVTTGAINISQTLVNTSNIPQTVSYRVLPVSGEAGACPGDRFTVTVLVNPQPSITAAQAQTVCSGTPFNITPVNITDGIVPSTTRYTWANPVDNPVGSITGQSAQLVATTSVGQSLNNITNAPATISYTVTPIAGSCTGANFTVVITVNPKPEIAAQARTICSEETFTVTPVNSADGIVPNNTTYTWNTAPTSNPAGAVTGWATQTTAANLISQQLTNTTNTAATLTYNVFPRSGAAGNCIGSPFNVVVSVNAKPVIGNQTREICSGSAFNVALTNSGSTIIPSGTTYTWFVSTDNNNITGQSNITIGQSAISQTLVNNTNVAQQITYTVRPTSGATGNCIGATFLVTVTVNPRPVITTQTQTICSNATFMITPLNGGNLIVPASTTYTWNTAPTSNPLGAISGGTAQLSSVSNISQLLTNNSNSQGLLTYIVTPTAGTAGRCVGPPFNVEITVSPKPILTSTLTPPAICNATNFSYNPISPTDGVSWVWTRNTVAGISNTAGTGTGVINETLINTTPNRITVPYTFTLTSYGCTNTQTVNVIVNPTPQLTSLLTLPAQCSGTPFYYNPTSATTGTTYAWTRANIAGISNPATTGTGAISETLINTSPNPIVVNYLYTLTANGCTNQQSISVTIDPLPIANFSIDGLRADCGPTTRRLINNSSVNSNPLTNGTFTWGIDILRNGGAVPVYSLINTNYTTQVNYTFTNTGIRDSLYPITLTAKSPNGCLNTYRDTITVHPDARIDLTIGTVAACAPFNAINSLNVVNKTDPSPDPTINLFSSYKWTIRDKRGNILSNTVSPTPPNYTLTNADDTLLIALKVNSLYGCRPDSVNRIVYTYQNPIVNFTVAPQNSCAMLSTQAVNTSYIGPNRTTSTLRYTWYANGSLLSNAQVPGTFNLINNSNTRDSIYTIKLVISETINNCKDSSSVGNLIVYPKPKAIFTIDKADEVCTTINGVNSSINNSSLFKNGTVPQYKWSVTYNNLYDTARAIIIDSTTAPFIAAKPNFKFKDAKGTVDTSYNINMMIYTVNGCIDTLSKSIKIRRRPNVDFTIPVEGCGVYIVNPTDNTINFPNDSLNRQWTILPTGGLSLFNANANNPYIIFPINNTANSIAYKVKQSVTVKGYGDCIDSLNKFITIHPKPTASFIVGKIDSCGPWTKTFRNTSDPKNGLGINAITSRWEVRKDNIVRLNTSAQNLTYTFTNTGVKDSVYTVRLFVSNPQGCLDTTAIQQITVHPNAKAFFNTDTLGCAPFRIRDHIKVQDFPEANDIWRYEWRIYDRFGFLLANYDSSVLAPDYVIQNESDTVTLQLIAYSKWGCSQDIFSRQVITRPNSVKANVTADSTICSNLPLAFTNTSYYGNNNQTAGLIYDWYVNDSKVTNLNSPTFIFRNNSNVSDSILYVKLVTTFTGTGCNDSVTKKITIYPAPAANFTVTTKEICGNPVGFKNFVTESVVAKNNVYNTAWSVTNLTLNKPSGLQVLPTSTNKRFQLQFGDNPGNIDTIYAVKLTATSINGCKADTTTNISLYRRPNVKFAISNTLVCGEITLQLTDQTSNVPTAKVWSYTTPTGNPLLFFPSATATSPKVLVPPNITGNLVSYYIKQLATTVNGCVDSAIVQLDAKALPTAVFSMSDTTSCIDSVTIRFKDQSIPRTPETITGWSWDFGDGITSNSQNPSHFYNKPGTYTISLVITNNEGCSSLPTRKRLVVYGSPRARFTMPKKVCQTDTIRFINNTVLGHGTSNFASEWNFGDGSSINTNANPSHVFTKPGIFIVSLKVKADSSCTTSTVYDTITVAGFPIAGFRHQFNCVNSPVNFIDTSKIGFADTLGTWKWTFDNGSFSSQPSPTQRFSSLRTYNVKLLVSGLACPNLKDSVTYPLLIDAPIASFNMSDSLSCIDTIQVKFTDLSSTYAPTTIRNWNWNFGDGNSSTLQNPTHVFRKPGKYFITLTVTNNEGCTSLPLIKQLIVYGAPKAAFVMPKQICLTDSIPFVNTSTLGYGSTKFISYTWDFGDGIPLNYTASPTHRFKFAGTFGVRLTVRADSSCMTSTYVDSVTVIGYPKAKFGIENYCVETPIFFRDSSVAGYADRLGSWKWNFGDNSFSSSINPVHIYKRTGTFPVQLVVSGNLCPSLQDSITVPLKIIDRRRDSVYAIKYLQYNVAQSLCALPGGDKYTWSPSTDINPISSRCVTINVQHPKTIYKITIIDSAGCTINDRQEIWGFPGTDIFLPRAFTPASNNRDNTIFKPIYVGVTAIKYFKIYDRFGHEVFSTSDMSKYWDGTSNGVNQPMETYTWIIQGFDYNNKPVIRQGNVTLIRYQ